MIVFWGRYWQNKVFPNSKTIAEMLIFVAAQHRCTFPLCSGRMVIILGDCWGQRCRPPHYRCSSVLVLASCLLSIISSEVIGKQIWKKRDFKFYCFYFVTWCCKRVHVYFCCRMWIRIACAVLIHLYIGQPFRNWNSKYSKTVKLLFQDCMIRPFKGPTESVNYLHRITIIILRQKFPSLTFSRCLTMSLIRWLW